VEDQRLKVQLADDGVGQFAQFAPGPVDDVNGNGIAGSGDFKHERRGRRSEGDTPCGQALDEVCQVASAGVLDEGGGELGGRAAPRLGMGYRLHGSGDQFPAARGLAHHQPAARDLAFVLASAVPAPAVAAGPRHHGHPPTFFRSGQ